MRFLSRIFIAAVIIMTAHNAFAAKDDAAPSSKISINRKRILVGDRIRYKVEIFSDLDLDIEIPKFKDNKIK